MTEQTETKPQDETNWKEIAMALARRVNWAVSNIDASGSGLVLNTDTGEARHWKIYMAEALRMIPGIEIDGEILNASCLPRSQRIKRIKQIQKERGAK